MVLKRANNKDPQKKPVSDIWQSNPKSKVKTQQNREVIQGEWGEGTLPLERQGKDYTNCLTEALKQKLHVRNALYFELYNLQKCC